MKKLTNDAVALYQYKAKARKDRLDRSLSQSSLASVVSSISEVSRDEQGNDNINTNTAEHQQAEATATSSEVDEGSQAYVSAEEPSLQEGA